MEWSHSYKVLELTKNDKSWSKFIDKARDYTMEELHRKRINSIEALIGDLTTLQIR